MSESPFRDRLMNLSDEASRTLPWSKLADYIDALNEEYQHFTWLVNQRKIGANVSISKRPKAARGGVSPSGTERP